MTIQFKPATREAVGLIIGLAGSSGSGKTFSAMRLATGLAGGKRFAVIDTEAGRAKHYADQFDFDHADLKPPFTPDAYREAIEAADKAGYPVIVVDSASHEWAGDGGILDMQEAELDRMAGNDYGKRERVKMAAWIKPKGAHKKMVAKLLQIRAHLILCFRAEEKVEMVKGSDGKMQIVPKKATTGLDGWMPISEKSLPYELTLSFLMLADKPGVPRPIKLQEQHKPFVDLSKPIDESVGQKLAAWAAGDDPKGSGAESAQRARRSAAPPSKPAEPDPDDLAPDLLPTNAADLKAAYKACDSLARLDDLERVRGELWDGFDRASKTSTKLASNMARDRLTGAST